LPIPTLETPRLNLRAFVPQDRDAIIAMLADTEAMEHMHFKSWNDEQRQQWFDEALEIPHLANPEGIGWAIVRKDTGEVIGEFGIGNPTDPEDAYDISFGYALARAHWSQGFMTEVLQAIFAYEFDTLGVPQLSANCRAPNIGSARAMEKAGMRRMHSDYGADFEGNWSHRHHYRITRDEWNAQKGQGVG
jgi:RimJ/RimL family protein N-acetyltransferase